MKTLSEIKAEVDRLAKIIEAGPDLNLTYGHREDEVPNVEVDERGYHLVVIERGQVQSWFITRDLDDLLYHIFKNVTSGVAMGYELVHRIETQDGRRLAFPKRVELLSQLSQNWGRRGAQEQKEILQEHPFDDQAWARLAQLHPPPQKGGTKAAEQLPLPLSTNEPDEKPKKTWWKRWS